MFMINEIMPSGRGVIIAENVGTAEEAVSMVRSRFNMLVLEEDADNPGCYDGLTKDGRQIAIEKQKGKM